MFSIHNKTFLLFKSPNFIIRARIYPQTHKGLKCFLTPSDLNEEDNHTSTFTVLHELLIILDQEVNLIHHWIHYLIYT